MEHPAQSSCHILRELTVFSISVEFTPNIFPHLPCIQRCLELHLLSYLAFEAYEFFC